MYTPITSSFGPNVAGLDEDDGKKTGEELQCADLPIVPLSLYSFIHRV
jgi:hypothetical protein